MNKIKDLIKKNRNLFILAKVIRFITSAIIYKIDGSKRKYPKVIQLPITYRCNSKCLMCNIWKMDHSNEMCVDEFGKYLADPIFKNVESVGINGGEPSLIKDLPKYFEVLLKLPKLKSLNIISNGLSKKLLLISLKEIYINCKRVNIHFHVSISLDGVGEIHNIVRGIPNAFKKTISTIDEIIKNKSLYCDSLDVACTIVKHNIDYLKELESFANIKSYSIKYRLGIENKRIESDKITEQYSIFNNSLQQSAKEFIHSQFSKNTDINDKYKYFSIFYWLNDKTKKRLIGCTWREEGITLDSRGDLYYCAVASKKIGSLKKRNGKSIFFDDRNIQYRKAIVKNLCDNCIHDYSGKIEIKNALIFLNSIVTERMSMQLYRFKAILEGLK